MHKSCTRTTPNQSPKAGNRASKKRAERSRHNGLDIVQPRGITAKTGSRRAKNQRKK